MDTVVKSVDTLEDNFRNIKYTKAGGIFNSIYSGDGIWSKVVFFILVLILFILLIRGGMSLLLSILGPKNDPILIDGLKDAKKPLLVNIDPSSKSSIPVIRSVNERGGLEFTWAVWMNIKNLETTCNGEKYSHVFNKGSEMNKDEETASRNGPGLYLNRCKNELKIVMDVMGSGIPENIIIENIPLNKWINVGIRVQQKTIDVFINGEIKKRHTLSYIPKQNYSPVYVNMNEGFDGEISELRYFSRCLTGLEFINLAKKGPNMRQYSKYGLPAPPYFSQRWFLSKFTFNDLPSSTSASAASTPVG